MSCFCFCFCFPDSCRNRPSRPPRKPLRPAKASRQLPPEPTHTGTDEVKRHLNSSLHKFVQQPWYASACDRKTADDALLRSNKDGAFMVRKSSGQDVHQPYTLVVFYKGRVYNIPIRFIPNTQQYALGRQKRGEEVRVERVSFLSFRLCVAVAVNHQRTPLVLIDSQSYTKDATKLCYPTKP
uniref:SH2 domain-containing protein n=1 Tax=Seriola lalandi dorsalis TaxID=1841481 RepID=A0A3B4YYU2_SERLL